MEFVGQYTTTFVQNKTISKMQLISQMIIKICNPRKKHDLNF